MSRKDMFSSYPPTPIPKPVVNGTAPPHPTACRYPVEIGWVQATRRWLPAAALALIGAFSSLGVALSSNCRAAGAQEERVEELRAVGTRNREAIENLDTTQRSQYERLFELTLKIDGRLQALDAKISEIDSRGAKHAPTR